MLLAGEFSDKGSLGLDGVEDSSAAWGDYDNDGRLDVIISGRGLVPNVETRVYHNDGNSTFEDISVELPVTSLRVSVTWGDYDNDGRLDILLTGGSLWSGCITRVYHNDGNGTFRDIFAELPDVASSSAAWGDYDNDGRLDILLAGTTGSEYIARVYHNDGNDTFHDISADLPDVYNSSVAWGDYDNDGQLDILLTGWTGAESIARVYHNDGNGTFHDISAGLTGVARSSVAWGDYDNDGRPDILLTGYTLPDRIARVYHNDGNGLFQDISAGLTGVLDSSVAWGDYDNDGRLDILISGADASGNPVTNVYHNDGDGTFHDISAGLTGVSAGSVAWGDYNNDGRLDILVTGRGAPLSRVTKVYHNELQSANAVPAAPTDLSVEIVSSTSATLSWAAPADDQTSASGLTYNLRVGTSPGGSDIVSPMADTESGWRRLAQRGMIQGTSWTLTGLAVGQTYYWSVQAVDPGLGGSPFAGEGTFSLPEQIPVLSTPNDSLRGVIKSQADVDWFQVSLEQGDTLRVRYHDGLSLYDDAHPFFEPTLEILDANGQVLSESSDSHSIWHVARSAGDYFVRLTSANTAGFFMGAYDIPVSVVAFAGATEREPNDTMAAVTALSGAGSFRGQLSDSSDVDYFSFGASAGDAVALKFVGSPVENPAVRFYDPSGVLLAVDPSGVGLSTIVSETGTYRFSLGTDNVATDVTGPYVGQLLVGSNATLENASSDAWQDAPVLGFGPYVVSASYLSPDPSFTTQGLVGSYVDRSLRSVASQDDWRTTQAVAGTRTDPVLSFPNDGWGPRSSVNLTRGTDDNWDEFSVQWDGYLRVVTDGSQVYTASDDGSRLWIDLNHDGVLDSSGPEYVSNNWGNLQGTTLGPASSPLAAGLYRIRVQYEDGRGGNNLWLLWTDQQHSAGTYVHADGAVTAGTLATLGDVDVFAVDMVASEFYEFRLEDTDDGLHRQNRLLTLYNELGQPLEYSTEGVISTGRYHNRPETTGRHYLTVQATGETGLGGYLLSNVVYDDFPTYRDIPLFFQDYSGYDKPEQIPQFLALFEAEYDVYQVDLTQTDPGDGTERVFWKFVSGGPGCGGASGGGIGTRRVRGDGDGNCTADWTRLADVWWGLFTHENGHGIGMPHTRQLLETMSPYVSIAAGDQYAYFAIGSYNRVLDNAEISTPKFWNGRSYLDWVLEAGRMVHEGESNDDLTSAQQLDPYLADMGADADPRNDQVVVFGDIALPEDADAYQITAAADETWAFDVDAAELQFPLDARLELLDSVGNVLASSQSALDRDTGINSVDPYLIYRFPTAGPYWVRLTSEFGTVGNYRLKVTPERAWDATGPRVLASWPDGDASVDGTRQLTFWINDQLDPSTLTAGNILVRGTTSGVRTGSGVFDPMTETLIWRADQPLPPDTYAVRLRGGTSGLQDLRGNRLDGETDGTLTWPELSGDGSPGGDFVTHFTVTAPDLTPAAVSWARYIRHEHERGMFELYFDDELDIQDVYAQPITLRGTGPDRVFDTADDPLLPVDVTYDPIDNTAAHALRVYTRGVPPPDTYRIEANLLDAAGNNVPVSEVFAIPVEVPIANLFTGPTTTQSGLVGSYVNQSLRDYAVQDDWRVTQTVRQRVDPMIAFTHDTLGLRNEVGITGGTDENWDDFSVQWDGVIVIPADGVRLYTRSDDGSRMWIDLNHDSVFDPSGSEFVDNHWGSEQGATVGPSSVSLNAGTYPIRIQYEDGGGGNVISLMWDYAGGPATWGGMQCDPSVVDVNVQPNTVLASAPATIDVTFTEPIDPATLNTDTFRLYYSPDADFFDGNDQLVAAVGNTIRWDLPRRRASFRPAATLTEGYYLIELDGQTGGVAAPDGRLLDGEYLDANIAGYTPLIGWNDSPSGDSRPGGDYRAAFRIDNGVNDPPALALQNTVTTLAEDVNTASRLKVADVVVTDDGLGTNELSLSGAHAALFELVGASLYLKAGTALDYETNPALDVTVAVDDATLGATPDDSKRLTVNVTDVNEATWHNASSPNDVNGLDGVTAVDVLMIIDYINSHPGQVTLPFFTGEPHPWYDVNNDGDCTAVDVLLVIDYINAHPTGTAEGEAVKLFFPSVPSQTHQLVPSTEAAGSQRAMGVCWTPDPHTSFIPCQPRDRSLLDLHVGRSDVLDASPTWTARRGLPRDRRQSQQEDVSPEGLSPVVLGLDSILAEIALDIAGALIPCPTLG
jgi:hypothetical protein